MRIPKGRATIHRLMGGPWNGQEALLRGDTMVFTVGEFRGRYVSSMVWRNNVARWEDVL